MGMMDKFKNFMGIPDENYEDDDMDIISSKFDDEVEAPAEDTAGKQRNKVVNIHATTQLQVVLVKARAL